MRRSDFSSGIEPSSLPPLALPLPDRRRSLGVRMSDFPPPPPSLPSYRGWKSGVALESTLAQVGRPYEDSLAFGAAVRLGLPLHTPSRDGNGCQSPAVPSCSCLRLLVASNGPHEGLPPSVIHPCPTHFAAGLPGPRSLGCPLRFGPPVVACSHTPAGQHRAPPSLNWRRVR
jgi:hypothetical protein